MATRQLFENVIAADFAADIWRDQAARLHP